MLIQSFSLQYWVLTLPSCFSFLLPPLLMGKKGMSSANNAICFAKGTNSLTKRNHNKTHLPKLQSTRFKLDANPLVRASFKEPVEFPMANGRGQWPSRCISVTHSTSNLMKGKTTSQLSRSPQLPVSVT